MSSKTVFFFSSLWLCWLEDRRCLCYNLSVGVNNRSADVRCIQTKFTRDNHLVNQFCHQRLCNKMYFELVDQPGHKSVKWAFMCGVSFEKVWQGREVIRTGRTFQVVAPQSIFDWMGGREDYIEHPTDFLFLPTLSITQSMSNCSFPKCLASH